MSELKMTRVFSRTPSSWDPQDDILLRHLKETQKLGWKEIAAHFSHRTPNACQFRWRRLRSGVLKTLPPASAPSRPAAAKPISPATAPTVLSESPPADGPALPPPLAHEPSPLAGAAVAVPLTAPLPALAQWCDASTSPRPAAAQWNGTAMTPQQAQADLEATALFYQQHAGRLYEDVSDRIPPLYTRSNSSTSLLGALGPESHSHLLSLQHILRRNSLANASLLGASLLMPASVPWSKDEDELLLYRRKRELSFAELSILLPTRSEGDIWGRIDTLEGVTAASTLAPLGSYGQAPVLGERSSSLGGRPRAPTDGDLPIF